GAKIRGRRIVLGALGDPALDDLDVMFTERRFVLRHPWRFLAARQDLFQQKALARLPGHDPRPIAFALLEEIGVAGHHEVPLGLRRLMAALALLLEDRPD